MAPLITTPYDVRRAQFLEALAETEAAVALGGVHVHQLRHGGASHDFATRSRTLEEVRRRGRWRSWASVRRYEKEPRVAQMLHRLPGPLLDRALPGLD